MHRLTARALLVLLLVGTFTPAALAISAPAVHACCLRKMHSHGSTGKAFQATEPARNSNCCPPKAMGLWAEPASQVQVNGVVVSQDPVLLLSSVRTTISFASADSVRGPPSSSFA